MSKQTKRTKDKGKSPVVSSPVPDVPAGGNTIPPLGTSNFKENPAKMWVFTVFDWSEELLENMIKACSSVPEINIDYVFGREICPDTQRPHLQCAIRISKKMRWRTIFGKILPDSTHREPAKGSWKHNTDYCKKDGKYESNLFFLEVKQHDNVPRSALRPWQDDLVKYILQSATEDRSIIWIFDEEGNNGKSFMCRWLVKNFGAIAMTGGKKHALACAFQNPKCPLFCFDIPRSVSDNISYESYENLRNGLFFSGFGTEATGMCDMGQHPVIVVFANCEPNYSKMSLDRWIVLEIDDERGLYKSEGPCDD